MGLLMAPGVSGLSSGMRSVFVSHIGSAMSLKLTPITLKTANEFVALYHRHHKPVTGHRFSIGVSSNGRLCGAAIISRPVARNTDFTTVAEVSRLVTDGTHNACSILYAAAARACVAMGYDKIQTFVLNTEPAVTLRAAGWKFDGMTSKEPRAWKHTAGPRRQDQPICPKQRWVKDLT